MSVTKFIQDTRKTARENGIKVRFEKKKELFDKGDVFTFAGYFWEHKQVLAIATNHPKETWLPILIHESCHMDQYLKDKYMWEKCNPGFQIFDSWAGCNAIIKREVLEEAVQDIIRLELDCERRTIAKIKKYNLDIIDLKKYIKTANINLYSYLFTLETKRMINNHDNPELLAAAPSILKKSYTKVPRRLFRAMYKDSKPQ